MNKLESKGKRRERKKEEEEEGEKRRGRRGAVKERKRMRHTRRLQGERGGRVCSVCVCGVGGEITMRGTSGSWRKRETCKEALRKSTNSCRGRSAEQK
eukprot:194950-Hanusia_phi.AAC.1